MRGMLTVDSRSVIPYQTVHVEAAEWGTIGTHALSSESLFDCWAASAVEAQ